MKKRIRGFLCILLGIVMILLYGCDGTGNGPGRVYVFDDGITEDRGQAGTETKEPQIYSYTQNFDQRIKANDPDWYVNSEGTFEDGVFKSKTNHAYFASKHKIKTDVFVAEWDVNTDRKGNTDNVSEYIGLRLPGYDDQFAAVGSNGIWFLFHNNKVGIIDTWPTVKSFKVDVDFSKTQRVRVTDNTVDNIITFEVQQEGEFRPLFSAVIEDGKNVFVKDVNGKDRIKAKFTYDIDTKGYFSLWSSGGNSGSAYIDNVEINWKEALPEQYHPADITLLRDLYSDTWVATDDLDRTVSDGAAAPRDKLVGMFYQIWFTPTSVTYSDQKIYDHNKIYHEGGFEALKKAYDKGPQGWGHYWGEPYFGYYLTNDKWIIRKHASMLSDIGVDFIFLDVTNGNSQTTSYRAIFKEYEQMRKEGLDTPDICFFIADNTSLVENVFLDIWDDVYSTGRYSDLYVMYDGKPLILGNLSELSEEASAIANENFTWRRCWALRENVKDGKDFWTWMHETPQVASYNSKKGNAVEEISISAGILANTSTGRSFSNGKQPGVGTLPDGTKDYFQFNLETTGQGLLFKEQMQRAQEVDPYVVLINEWNEWIAGRWEGTGHPTIANTYVSWSDSFYVDCFDPEFSRDIEPMKGGFGDNYYYQLAAFLRTFKGGRTAPAASGQHEISLNGGLDQWSDVWPEYRDTTGDTLHRDSLGYGGLVSYKNDSGRNDIVSAKVSRANGKTYFLAVCADSLTPREGENWMNLFIDTDGNSANGWHGYDLIINRDNGSIEKFTDGWNMQKTGQCELFAGENYLVLAVDDASCGLGADFNFKWSDNSTTTGEIMQFLDLGDAAPNARFNYAYRTKAKETKLTANVKTVVGAGASFTANRPYALSDGKIAAVYGADTAVLPEMHKNRLFVPASSLDIIKDMTVTVSGGTATVKYKNKTFVFEDGNKEVKRGNDTYQIPVAPYVKGNVLYVPLNAAAFIAGLNYVQNDLGVAIVTPAKLPNEDKVNGALNELYISY